ncbi:tetratricopeptide repeat protein [Aspergillus tanneri]|uniref:MalT-like TPR region domain-containing protein n=1 Tax=Aspergillus tanneri TaxID=1220188 RepID=A0A5M9MG69_9EURO|nr:uncharacterized protein ATNIH1004_008664 [Aspergillus tanneri]KAA8644460.1 hypothetical protein ATNIH1004_008664 [Aspergillus tanneri]
MCPYHLSKLRTLNKLGNLYARQRNLQMADEMYIRALAAKEEYFGRKEGSTLDTVNNLASLYAFQQRLDEATNVYYGQGRHIEASLIYQHELYGREKVLMRLETPAAQRTLIGPDNHHRVRQRMKTQPSPLKLLTKIVLFYHPRALAKQRTPDFTT